MKARSGQNHDYTIAPPVNFNPTAAIIMDMLCIFVISKQFYCHDFDQNGPPYNYTYNYQY